MHQTRNPEKMNSGLFWQLSDIIKNPTLSALPPQFVNFIFRLSASWLQLCCHKSTSYSTLKNGKRDVPPNCSIASVPFQKSNFCFPVKAYRKTSGSITLAQTESYSHHELQQKLEKGVFVFQTPVLARVTGLGLAFEIQPIVYGIYLCNA